MPPAEPGRQPHTGENQEAQVKGADQFQDHRQHQERQARIGIAGIDELDEEGDEEQDRLGIRQAEQQRLAERLVDIHLFGLRRRRFGIAQLAPGAPQHADAEIEQVGRTEVLQADEQHRLGLQQGRHAKGRQQHQHRVAEEHAAGGPVAGRHATLGRSREDEQRVRPGQQDHENHTQHVGPEIGYPQGRHGSAPQRRSAIAEMKRSNSGATSCGPGLASGWPWKLKATLSVRSIPCRVPSNSDL